MNLLLLFLGVLGLGSVSGRDESSARAGQVPEASPLVPKDDTEEDDGSEDTPTDPESDVPNTENGGSVPDGGAPPVGAAPEVIEQPDAIDEEEAEDVADLDDDESEDPIHIQDPPPEAPDVEPLEPEDPEEPDSPEEPTEPVEPEEPEVPVEPEEPPQDVDPDESDDIADDESDDPEDTPSSPVEPESADAIAFAGAEGFGMHTVGGRGGQIVKVTNLDDSGEGSLRWALEDIEGPRIVVFEVGGVIELQSEIEIENPYVTVAGQTALGDGVTITGARIQVDTDEVIIRGLKLRPGDDDEGQEFSSRDGISVGSGSSGDPISNIIIDHNSIAWATDENSSIWGNVSNMTFSNNIVAQGLETPTEIGRSSMGMIVSGGEVENITIAQNFFAHNEDRNPYLRDVENAEIVNNYIYNYGASGLRLANEVSSNVIGNVFEAGTDSPERAPLYLADNGSNASDYYLSDNIWIDGSQVRSGTDVAHTDTQFIRDDLVFDSNVDAMDSSLVKDYVLGNAGATPGAPDEIDAYFIQTARSGTGEAIDTLSESPLRVQDSERSDAYLDSDGDGMPDWFESWYAPLDPNEFDAHGDIDGDGFTNVEEYLNGLITGFDNGETVIETASLTRPDYLSRENEDELEAVAYF